MSFNLISYSHSSTQIKIDTFTRVQVNLLSLNHRILRGQQDLVLLSSPPERGDARGSDILEIIKISWAVLFIVTMSTSRLKAAFTLLRKFLFYFARHPSEFFFRLVFFTGLYVILELLLTASFFVFNLLLFVSLISAVLVFSLVHGRFFVVIGIFLGVFAIFRFLSFTPLCASVLKPNLKT